MYFVVFSVPNRNIDPYGEVSVSTTPFSIKSRVSDGPAGTLVAPSVTIQAAKVACDGRTFAPFRSVGTTIFFLE